MTTSQALSIVGKAKRMVSSQSHLTLQLELPIFKSFYPCKDPLKPLTVFNTHPLTLLPSLLSMYYQADTKLTCCAFHIISLFL